MKQNNFTVIKGGESMPHFPLKNRFISAYATNTRLMGVVVLCLKWKAFGDNDQNEFYQLFYYDAEEYGLDRYESFWDTDYEGFEMAEASMIGGLGGEKVSLSLQEALCLLREFIEFNNKHSIALPGKRSEYEYYLKEVSPLASPELASKLCEPINSQNHLINYFMMRYFGKDFEGAKLLVENIEIVDYYPQIAFKALLQNTVDPIENEDDQFMCESVLETYDGYLIITSYIKTKDWKITSYEPISSMVISDIEAAFKLNQPEYITIIKYKGAPEAFDLNTTPRLKNAMLTEHEFGNTYMIFNSTNEHVDKKVYRLDNDVFGTYYVSIDGEIIIASKDFLKTLLLEHELKKSDIASLCQTVDRVNSPGPILSSFIESGFETFEQFLNELNKE